MLVAVYVTPKANADKVTGWREGVDGAREVSVRVTAAPEKGKATKAAGKVLAAFFVTKMPNRKKPIKLTS